MGNHKGKSRRVGMIVVLCGSLLLLLSLCQAAQANYWDGMTSDQSVDNAYTGARVNIDNYPVHTTTGGIVSTWPMLANVHYGGHNALAQIGWIKGRTITNDSNLWYFYEYEATTGVNGPHAFAIVPDGSIWETSHLYTVQFDGTNTIRFRVDGVLRHTTTQQSATNWLPTFGEWSAERHLSDDYFPGDSQYPNPDPRNHRVRFYNPCEYSNGAWHFLDPSGRTFADAYGGQSHSTTNQDFHTWDTRAQW